MLSQLKQKGFFLFSRKKQRMWSKRLEWTLR